MRVVIGDAGPLIALARIGQLDLLQQVYAAVFLTSGVADEIGIHGSP
jgi:predicted nucleic acid-binding protein